MNTSEFKKLKDSINETIEIYFNDSPIMVKKYLSCDEKQALIDLVLVAYFNSNNDFTKDIYFKYGVLKNYTDIKLPQIKTKIIDYDQDGQLIDFKHDDISLIYDIAISSGLWDIIVDTIDPPELEGVGELEELEYYIDLAIKEEKQKRETETRYENSFQAQLEKTMIILQEKVPGLLEDMVEAFNNFDPDKLTFITQALDIYKKPAKKAKVK